MRATFTIRREPPDQPDVVALIEALDAYANALYPPESNHLLDIAALSAPAVSFLVVRDGGEAVGCGAILRDARGWGEVKRMYVRPDQRGRGVGQAHARRDRGHRVPQRLPAAAARNRHSQHRGAGALPARRVCANARRLATTHRTR